MNAIEQLQNTLEVRRRSINYSLLGLATGGVLLLLTALLGAQVLNSKIKTGLLVAALSCFGTGTAITATETHRKGDKQNQQLNAAVTAANKQRLTQELGAQLAIEKLEAQQALFGWVLSQPDYMQGQLSKELGLEAYYNALYQTLGYNTEQAEEWQTVNVGASMDSPKLPPGVPNQWIVDIVASTLEKDREKRQNHHAIVAGGTQEGKSHFIKKFIELTVRGSEHIYPGKGVVLNLIDPKYPMSKWDIMPSYIGFDKVSAGIFRAYEVLQERKKAEMRAVEMAQPTSYPFYFVIVDEWELSYGKGKGYSDIITNKQAEQNHAKLNILIKEGAAYDIKVMLIVQNPDSSCTGFAMNDLGSIAQIVMGTTAKRYLSHQAFPFREYASELSADVDNLLSQNKRFGLFIPTRGLPSVNEFENCKVDLSFAAPPSSVTPGTPSPGEPKEEPKDEIKDPWEDTKDKPKDEIKDPWEDTRHVSLTDHYMQLSRWFNEYLAVHEAEPNSEELKRKFEQVTGNTIEHPQALTILREKLRSMIR